ncbi:MAG: BrxA family protein [Candidatus Competibacteraceae bacterium]
MTAPKPYTTQLQAGLGLIQETRVLLALWQPGMSGPELYQAALQAGAFPAMSARRLRNMITEGFVPRYLYEGARPARTLKMLTTTLMTGELNQLFFLYTCRAHSILADFVREVYWVRYAGGGGTIANALAQDFIRRAIDDGKTARRWSESTLQRVASYLTGTCADYGLLGKLGRQGRQLLPYRLETRVAVYLAYELHFGGLGDNALLAHPDWQLFGLDRQAVRDTCKRLSLHGYFILQTAGDVTHIGWTYKNWEELSDGLAQG